MPFESVPEFFRRLIRRDDRRPRVTQTGERPPAGGEPPQDREPASGGAAVDDREEPRAAQPMNLESQSVPDAEPAPWTDEAPPDGEGQGTPAPGEEEDHDTGTSQPIDAAPKRRRRPGKRRRRAA